jgi:uncharacterized membrane protein (UPF0127 family)
VGKAVAAQRVVNERTGEVVAANVRHAAGPWQSFKGLMFVEGLPDGHGVLFRPAQGIHTQFMRFPIDVVFLDKRNRVTKIREAMPPWRFDFTFAAGCIELNPGHARAHDIQTGDTLRFEPLT